MAGPGAGWGSDSPGWVHCETVVGGSGAGAGPAAGHDDGRTSRPCHRAPVSPPRVSICVPAYRAERFLATTIQSVLAQTFTDWELIVLDNASPDRTGEIARWFDDPRIRVECNRSTLDLVDNWNTVAAMARGTYLKVLCADDLIGPECLEREVEILERHPDVAIVAARRNIIGALGDTILRGRGLEGLIGHQEPAEVARRVVRSGVNPIGWPSALLIRRTDFEAVGGFDRRWLHPVDLDLWLRLLSRGALYGIDESLASFRISDGSVTAQLDDTGAQHRAAIGAFVERSPWPVTRTDVVWCQLRSRLEQVRLRLLFVAANSRSPVVRQLPALVLERRWPRRRQGSSTVTVLDSPAPPSAVGRLDRSA